MVKFSERIEDETLIDKWFLTKKSYKRFQRKLTAMGNEEEEPTSKEQFEYEKESDGRIKVSNKS